MPSIDYEMKTRFENEKHRLLANLVFTGHWIKTKADVFITPFGISSQQFNILRILRGAKDWLNMNEIKSRMVEKSPNTTRLCDKLVQKGLIERERGEMDKRVVCLRITENGMNILQEIADMDDGSLMDYTENITEEEAKLANQIINKLRE